MKCQACGIKDRINDTSLHCDICIVEMVKNNIKTLLQGTMNDSPIIYNPHTRIENMDGELKEKPKWYEWYICKVWRANYAMNQNEGQKHFALTWGHRTKYVDKPHWCSFTDRDHKICQDFDKAKKAGTVKFREIKI